MKSLRHLRETDPADVCERVEELPQWLPWHQPSCPASETPGAMARSASSIARRRSRVAAISAAEIERLPGSQPQVRLIERGRGIAGLEAP